MTPPRRKTVTAKTDSEVLMPEPVEHRIGDRTFVQTPLTLRTMGGVLAVTATITARIMDDREIMIGFANIDTSTMAGRAAIMQAAIKAIMAIPPELPAFLAAVLNVESIEDADYIGDHCRPVVLLKIIDTFIEQNEPEEMIQAFFALQTRLSGLELTHKILEMTKTN